MHDPTTKPNGNHSSGASSLEPTDWDSFRELGHRMLDELVDHLRTREERPVWQPVPIETRNEIAQPLPEHPQGTGSVCDEFKRLVLPYINGNTHPSFFGWVHGSGTPGGMLAEMMAAAINCNLGGREQAPIYIEQSVIDWMKQLFGYPDTSSGLLVSGTSMATLNALTVARNLAVDWDVRQHGLKDAANQLVAYTSTEGHSSIDKAIEMLGLGRDQLKKITVDDDRRMNVSALRKAIENDLQNGLTPFAVIATVGTVNTGAIDDLLAIGEVCQNHGIWLHVDGAFGASIVLSKRLRHRLEGIDQADSIAFDFHKWMHVPYDAGCLLVRDGQKHRNTFCSRPDYLASSSAGLASSPTWFCDYGPELSRGFRALKVWFTLKEQGTNKLASCIEKNCAQASWLAAEVRDQPHFELVSGVAMNIVCFRFADARLPERTLEAINHEIVNRLHEEGIAAPSTTQIDGRMAIRVCLTNHRTERSHLAQMLVAIRDLGVALVRQHLPQASPTLALQPRISFVPASHTPDDPELLSAYETAARLILESPEFATLSDGACLEFSARLIPPVQVLRDRIVVRMSQSLDADVLRHWLGHALELRMLGSQICDNSDLASYLASTLLAARASAARLESMPDAVRLRVQATLSSEMAFAYDVLSKTSQSAIDLIESYEVMLELAQLKPLGGMHDLHGIDESIIVRANQWLEQLLPLALPTEQLLVSGGDDRIAIDPTSRVNRYGCAPLPDPTLASFSSSTSTTIPSEAFADAEHLRQRLIKRSVRDGFARSCSHESDRIKRELIDHVDLDHVGLDHIDRCQIVLAASGTDCELFTLKLANDGTDRPITNIVIAACESGSGVVHAGRGAHYSTMTAQGNVVDVGEPIEELQQPPIEFVEVAARSTTGQLRSLRQIQADVESIVADRTGAGHRCCVHLMDCAKTGWTAPELDFMSELKQRYPEHIDVVVDACQWRISPAKIRRYVQHGFMVQLTGSKFMAGPAFCGVLILPPCVAERANHIKPIAKSLGAYASKPDWPTKWSTFCQGLQARPNVGLLFRWSAALRLMSQYSTVPEEAGLAIRSELHSHACEVIAASGRLRLLDRVDDDHSAECRPSRIDTIIPFVVDLGDAPSGSSLANVDDAKQIYRLLSTDLGSLAGGTSSPGLKQCLTRRFQLGQPVAITTSDAGQVGAIRICFSAHTITQIYFDQQLGATLSERIESYCRLISLAMHKTQLIAEHWEQLSVPSQSKSTQQAVLQSKRRKHD